MANRTKRTSLVGKGDRPRKVDQKKFSDSYDNIFAKGKKDEDRKL
jgi:hypothetical protein